MEKFTSADTQDNFFDAEEEFSQQVLYGLGASDRIGELVQDLGRSALLVTDQGLSAAGHPQKVSEDLERAGLQVTLFDQSI